jgi:hypothetical protein
MRLSAGADSLKNASRLSGGISSLNEPPSPRRTKAFSLGQSGFAQPRVLDNPVECQPPRDGENKKPSHVAHRG